MTKNKKVNRRKPKKEQQGNILPFITGLSIGLFVAFVVYLKGDRAETDPSLEVTPGITVEGGEQTTVIAKDKTDEKPSFDFYTILPEREVKVPEWEPPKKKTPKVVDESAGNFVFQVGSFQKHTEADSLKAKLAIQGLPVYIRRVVNGQNTWYRVRVGPYQDKSKLPAVRKRLASVNMDYMLLQVKEGE